MTNIKTNKKQKENLIYYYSEKLKTEFIKLFLS